MGDAKEDKEQLISVITGLLVLVALLFLALLGVCPYDYIRGDLV